MADRIELKAVECFGYHGVLAAEKESGQKFFVDATCWLDFAAAAASDDLTQTVNYAELAELIHRIVTGPSRDLIETVAAEIADAVMTRYDSLHAVEITIHKPAAPIPFPFGDVAVVARRSRRR
ncbi:dihydroneopterin aldolase [Corynebacterium sp. H128]|uniref:dihydroneopterin aldolase n=1 Tax=Corynebacterium sp. H128 TaxID=3133427 RepID=UPI0030A2B53A